MVTRTTWSRPWLSARVGAQLLLLRLTLPALYRALSLPHLLRLLTLAPAAPGLAPRTAPTAAAVRAVLQLSARLPGRGPLATHCLYRALLRYALLHRLGLPGLRFVMGLRREGEQLQGHAWVEQRGRPLGEPATPAYRVTFVYPLTEQP